MTYFRRNTYIHGLTQHTLVWTNTGEWEVQVRIEDKNKNGEGSFVYLMIQEKRLKSIIRVLSAVYFLVEILTSRQVLEKKKKIANYPQVNLTGQGVLSLCSYLNVSNPIGGFCTRLVSQFGYCN